MGSDSGDLIPTNMTASPSPFVVLPLSLSGKSPQGQKAPLVYEAQNVMISGTDCSVSFRQQAYELFILCHENNKGGGFTAKRGEFAAVCNLLW